MISKRLYALQFETLIGEFDTNMSKLHTLICECEDDSIIVAPEVCISGFCYDNIDGASAYATTIIQKLLDLSKNKVIITTLIEKIENKYYNTLYVFYQNKIVHTQSKYKLFALGDETRYFDSGAIDSIKIVQIDSIKIAFLICFELRFVELWLALRGADIICVPAMWGASRKEHYATLTKSLAIINQCFVIASDSANDDMAKNSAIITPFGDVTQDDTQEIITIDAKLNDIVKMRRYLNTGI